MRNLFTSQSYQQNIKDFQRPEIDAAVLVLWLKFTTYSRQVCNILAYIFYSQKMFS